MRNVAEMREQAVQVVVDDGLGLLDRGLAAEGAGAQARGHGDQAEGFQVRVQVGRRVAGGLGGPQLCGDANPSVPRALMTPPAACAAWLDELLAQLRTARCTWWVSPTAAGLP
jgi:hypothetical protein